MSPTAVMHSTYNSTTMPHSRLYHVLRDCVEAATKATSLAAFTATLHSITAFFCEVEKVPLQKIVGKKLEFGLCNRVCVFQTESMCDQYRAGDSRKNFTKVTTILPRPVLPASGGRAIQTVRMMRSSESMAPVGACAHVGSCLPLWGREPLGANLLKTPLIL